MRPRHLELTAFGPYAGTVRLDFDDLSSDGLFLVHGPTGAGKTSILDGMTYALYGGVAGTRRTDRLRSDHADPRVHTAVAFEFSLRGSDYRVTRVPPHERAKKTGTGTTKQKAKASLSVRRGDAWEPIAEGVEDVGQHVVDLVGLSREQFHQVVVLPQGDFAKALHADANERRKLLSSLFRTERFDDYTQRLLVRAKEAEAQASAAAAVVDGVVEQAAGRWSCILTTVEVVPDTVDEMALHAAVVAEAVATHADTAAATADAAAAALEDARVAHERRERLDRARRELAELDTAHDEMELVRTQLAAARRAEPLQDYLDVAAAADAAVDDLATSTDEVRAVLEQIAAEAPHILQSCATAAASADGDAALTTVRDEVHAAMAALRNAADAQREVRRLADEAAAHETAAATSSAAAAAAQRTITAIDAECDELRTRHERAVRAAERVAALRQEHERLSERADAAAAVARLQPQVETAATATLQAKEALNDALDEHRRLLERRIDEMAAELADALVPGEPCSVCGATAHPAPASAAESFVSRDCLAEAAAEVDAAQAGLAACEEAESALRLALAEAAAIARSATVDALAHDLDNTQRDLAQQCAAAADLDDVDARLSSLAAQRESTHDELEEATAAAAEAAAALEQCRRRSSELSALVTQGAGDADPDVALGQAEQLLDAVTALTAAVAAQDRVERDAAAAQQRLRQMLERHGFDDVGAARDALLPAEIMEQYRTTLAALDRRRAAAEAVLDEHGDSDNAQPVDLAQVRADKAAADRTLQDAQLRLGVVTQAARDLADLATRLRQADAAAQTAAADAANLRRLADICNGTGNAQRMSLERYVLAAYFEEIADAASQRLQAMTDGRYTLRHSDERARGGAASGLSIMVHDAYTGTEREAGSLSGGETFQASLCLALGVADVVQRHAGGIHLDMLFIDEGFGALDAEALEQAMAELDALREGGRLVGVISHVPALRERITSGVLVTKTTTGSDARVVVPAEV